LYTLDEHGQLPPLACRVKGCEALHPNAFADDPQLQGWRCPEHDPTEIAMHSIDEIYEGVFDMKPSIDESGYREFREAAVAAAALRCPTDIVDQAFVVRHCVAEVLAWLKYEREWA
jgi:hypothetical protein